MPSTAAIEPREPNKLVLCFDGTGNTFSGSNADTNVVKILNKLDRHHPKQFHYYQPGVGTYDVAESMSVHKTPIGSVRSSISQTLDSMLGTTFDAHVMAGYRFLMRYYQAGDKIYMFGFSRGAFTARFLARMVNTVGLLCMGNEEMVPFAYKLYQRYLAGELEDKFHSHAKPAQPNGNTSDTQPVVGDPQCDSDDDEYEYHGDTFHSANDEITAFSNTFCRKEPKNGNEKVEVNVKVHFLGIWDCVNSVAVLESNVPLPTSVSGTADIVRHAVATDERRVKFKPSLIAQDVGRKDSEDIKEVWFPGCHGDVGGGWPATEDDNVIRIASVKKNLGVWQRIKNFWTTKKAKGATQDVTKDVFQMSDVPLSWMIRELEIAGEANPQAAIKWSKNKDGYKRAFNQPKAQQQALNGLIHDSLIFGQETGFFKVLLWRFMEILPTITRWELVNNKWEIKRFPLNNGGCRDIPEDAVLHHSLIERLKNVSNYSPRNNHGGSLPPCLKNNGQVQKFKPVQDDREISAQLAKEVDKHQTYQFADVNKV